MIKDVPKTLVYDLCRSRNLAAVLAGDPAPIPDSVLDKPPSAELRPDQHDDQVRFRPTKSSTRYSRATSKRTQPHPTSWRKASTPPSSNRWCVSSMGPSTSGARCRRVCGSAPRPLARTVGCPSPIATDGSPREAAGVADPSSMPGVTQAHRPIRWRSVEDLAEWVGGYCWAEYRVFEVAGRWASRDGDPALRVTCSVLSARHAGFAGHWRDRLPVPPADAPRRWSGRAATRSAGGFARLDEAGRCRALAASGLCTVVVPWLLATYEAHLAEASPVAEAPVIALLRRICWSLGDELGAGDSLGGAGPTSGARGELGGRDGVEFVDALKRSFETP